MFGFQIGINPGLYSAYIGHHYSNANNHFCKYIHFSTIVFTCYMNVTVTMVFSFKKPGSGHIGFLHYNVFALHNHKNLKEYWYGNISTYISIYQS